jgi:hypothetical protein
MPGPFRLSASVLLCTLTVLSGCAPGRIELPSGAGAPFSDAAPAYETAAGECRTVKTIGVSLALSGRAGSTSIRGSVDAGFEAPEKIRLEGRHPFGRPVFILAAAGSEATLYLPRDNRVLKGAGAAEIVEALIGLPLGGGDLRTLVSGCGFEIAGPTGGRQYPDGWIAVDTGRSTTYLRQVNGTWRIVAASRPPLVVHYAGFAGARASTVRLQASGPSAADVTARISDLTMNVPFGPGAFDVDVPAAAEPLTLADLRQAGPLGVQ